MWFVCLFFFSYFLSLVEVQSFADIWEKKRKQNFAFVSWTVIIIHRCHSELLLLKPYLLESALRWVMTCICVGKWAIIIFQTKSNKINLLRKKLKAHWIRTIATAGFYLSNRQKQYIFVCLMIRMNIYYNSTLILWDLSRLKNKIEISK